MSADIDLDFLKRFEKVSLVGKGAFGRVYRAIDPARGGPVAVKVLLRNTSEDVRRRFDREAKVLQELASPHLVRVFDADLEHDPPFLLMEWLGGGSLGDVIRPATPADPTRAREVARQLLLGIRDLHQAQLLHRDIKPHNVMLREDGTIALGDLGLVGEEVASSISATGQVMGTPRYMPPEVLLGKRWSPEGDLFAAGVTLWEFAVGQHPSARFQYALTAFLNPDLELPLMEHVGGVRNPALERLVAALLQHRPEDRPRYAEEALELLGDEAKNRAGDAAALAAYTPGLHAPAPDEEDEENLETWVDASEVKVTAEARARASSAGEKRAGGGTTARLAPTRPLSPVGSGTRSAISTLPATPTRALALRASAAAGLGGLLLLGAWSWGRQPAPGEAPPALPEEEVTTFPDGFVPGVPAVHYREGGKIELVWESPVKAYAEGSVRSHEGILEVPRGRSSKQPSVQIEGPGPGETYGDLRFLLVDREGKRRDVPIPAGWSLRALPDQAATFLGRVREEAPLESTLRAWRPLASAFEEGVLGRALGAPREVELYAAAAALEHRAPEVVRSTRRRLDVRELSSPPVGRHERLDLPRGELPTPLPGGEGLRFAAFTGIDPGPLTFSFGIVDGPTLRIQGRGAEYVGFVVPRAWVPDRHPAYVLTHEDSRDAEVQELRVYLDP